MKIDDNHYLEKDEHCITLVKQETKQRTYSKSKGKTTWEEGDDYTSEERFYYPNVKMALKGYLRSKVSEANEVEDIVHKIEEAERNIDNLKVLKL